MVEEWGPKVGRRALVSHSESALNGKEGEIVEIVEDGNPAGPIGVLFEQKDLSFIAQTREERILRFTRGELDILEASD